MKEILLIIDFGSQYTQLIARRVRELNVCSEIVPFNKFSTIPNNTKGIILSLQGNCISFMEFLIMSSGFHWKKLNPNFQ